MVKYACAKKVPDSTKLHLIKGQKTKFPSQQEEAVLSITVYTKSCLQALCGISPPQATHFIDNNFICRSL